MARKAFAEKVREAAAGRWKDVIVTIGNCDPGILDGGHHPCPRCGGTDRFRMIDEDDGSLYCNQCFSSKNGDGFAAVGWLRGVGFKEAVKLVAQFVGIVVVDPAKNIEFEDWNESLAALWCLKKIGVTVESLVANGARQGRYRNQYNVMIFPVYSRELDPNHHVGYVMYDISGGVLPKWDKGSGKIPKWVKVKLSQGSERGIVGLDAVKRLAALRDRKPEERPAVTGWKVEGVTDMLAFYSAVPDELRAQNIVLCNANGTMERPGWIAEKLAPLAEVFVVHDADRPGQTGAIRWTQEIRQYTAAAMIDLPYEVEENHGRDLREYLADHSFEQLREIAPKPIRSVNGNGGGRTGGSSAAASGGDDFNEYLLEKHLLNDIDLDVLGEFEGGRIKLFSRYHRKIEEIKDIGRLTFPRLLQICGPPAKKRISETEDDSGNFASFKMAQQSIGIVAGQNRISVEREAGQGVWRGRNTDGEETERIVLVNAGEALEVFPDGSTSVVTTPRSDGLILDFSSSDPWYSASELSRMIHLAKTDPAWAQGVMDRLTEIFGRWRWKFQDETATVLAGLVPASWIQTLWKWRPLVAITGATNAGKSTLFQVLAGTEASHGMFGSLAIKSSHSTEAGIRQMLRHSSQIVLIDEFEESPHRQKLLELFRTSGRGEQVLRGTSSQRAERYGIKNIVWVAGIEIGLKRAPDRNRFIILELIPPLPHLVNKLSVPEPIECYRLGQESLAVALAYSDTACAIAEQLRKHRFPGYGGRVVESYSVPAAMVSAVYGYTPDQAVAMLGRLLASVETEQDITDEHDLFSEILAAMVDCGRGEKKAVSQLLANSPGEWSYKFKDELESHGIAIVVDRSGARQAVIGSTSNQSDLWLFLDHNVVTRRLLAGSPWQKQSIDQIIARMPGAKRSRKRIAGRNARGVQIPMDYVSHFLVGQDESDSVEQRNDGTTAN